MDWFWVLMPLVLDDPVNQHVTYYMRRSSCVARCLFDLRAARSSLRRVGTRTIREIQWLLRQEINLTGSWMVTLKMSSNQSKTSTWCDTCCGSRQGSSIGPIVFFMFKNDKWNNVSKFLSNSLNILFIFFSSFYLHVFHNCKHTP